VNQQVEVEVRSTKPMTSYVYEVLGRGTIVFAQTVQANGLTNHTFKFPCLLEMAPRARVLVYFTNDNGEIVADSIMFEAGGTFQNKVLDYLLPFRRNQIKQGT
jgi:CD109 antigen